MAATEVKGGGRQKGIALQWRAGDYRVEFIPKMKLEVCYTSWIVIFRFSYIVYSYEV